MPATDRNNDFLSEITKIILENISDDSFGVSELAEKVGMSRSNLLRKVQKASDLSVSLFIRKIRLEKAKELLLEKKLTVSEISFEVGFSSTSYFIKCFREQYGYPPGETLNKLNTEEHSAEVKPNNRSKFTIPLSIGIVIVLIVTAILVLSRNSKHPLTKSEKSIAVLPFKNDSNDSTNLYLVNGLMEAILNNLQQIEDLKVISRTSVEKYRNSGKTIPEIAKELDVKFFVEGSGQKIGNQILLNVQLIEGKTDKHLWAQQYDKEVDDIFDLQRDVAKNIAVNIEAIITPQEAERINKPPTENIEAYDLFLKGREQMNLQSREGLFAAIPLLENAIEKDENFARAYAALAMCYFYLDIFQHNKTYTKELHYYSDKAFLLDSELPQSLVAKALFYMHQSDYQQAIPYLEKALEYNPNWGMAINYLSDIYTGSVPNTEKYLEYALKGISINRDASDSSTTSISYLHVSNAFIQTGFIDEALHYINMSISYDPNNLFSPYVRGYILYARDRDFNKMEEILLKTFQRDTTRLDVMQELGNFYYYQRNYEKSYQYYKKFEDIKASLNLDIYEHKKSQIAFVYDKMGFTEEAKNYYESYREYAENDQSIYRHLALGMFEAQMGNKKKALEHFRLFTQEDNYHYWTILFTAQDPMVESIKNDPEFKRIMIELETKFWKNHHRIKNNLEKNGLL